MNLEVNLFFILKTTFKLTQGRTSWIVFSKVDLAESDNFPLIREENIKTFFRNCVLQNFFLINFV